MNKKEVFRLLRDRGTIKWTAMMLPEHVKLLREWKNEEQMPIRRQPDEQHYEEWNYRMAEAMEFNRPLTITHWRNGRPVTQSGFIHHIDESARAVRMVTIEGDVSIILLKEIENISESE